MSKVFRFSLQSILEYRQGLLDTKARELAEAQRTVQSLLHRSRDLETNILSSQREALGERTGAIDILRAKQHERHRLSLAGALVALETEIHKAREILTVRQDSWMQAKKEVRILEKLRERLFENWKTAEKRSDQKLTDEIGNRAAARQLRSVTPNLPGATEVQDV
ncbi:MAG: flagellar export protein FliJ [Planctomycetota bacterium]|jgi:flagellar FliJ protein|nr:flagellar export protein FliJ [Planctomycetota bacterium]